MADANCIHTRFDTVSPNLLQKQIVPKDLIFKYKPLELNVRFFLWVQHKRHQIVSFPLSFLVTNFWVFCSSSQQKNSNPHKTLKSNIKNNENWVEFGFSIRSIKIHFIDMYLLLRKLDCSGSNMVDCPEKCHAFHCLRHAVRRESKLLIALPTKTMISTLEWAFSCSKEKIQFRWIVYKYEKKN